MAKHKATHRLRRPHQVFYDPTCHFLKGDKPDKGARVTLPSGTHLIPTEGQLANLPDRFESLVAPELPAEAEVDDDDDEDDQRAGDPASSSSGLAEEEEADEASTSEAEEGAEAGEGAKNTADEAVDFALSEVNGEWDALTSVQLEDLAAGYDIEADDIEGTGSAGNVLKGDWMAAVQGARGVTE